jgi:ACS family hexuronate transporter-like MFS transporter
MNKRLRWWMLGFAFTATVINYLDRQALSVAAPVLRTQFHLSNSAYAHIIFVFLLAYTLMNGLSGLVIDRLGTKIGYGLFVGWWSLSALLHSFAQGPLTLGAFRFLLGLGEAGNWPGAVKIVAEWFEPKERSTASGMFNSGSAIGAILAPPIIAFMLIHYGWRSAFTVVGASGFLWLTVWLIFYRSPGSVQTEQTMPIPYKSLLRSKFVWTFTLSKIFFDPVWYFYTFWFPEYLSHARHFDMASIGRFAWIPFLVAGLGSIFGGFLSRGLLVLGASITVARKASVSIAAALMLTAIPAVLVESAAVSIALISIAMAGYTAGLANMLPMPADVVPSNRVAFVYGIASMGSGIGGMIFTLLTGWLVDHYSYVPVFFVFGLIPIVCSLILWLSMGPLDGPASRREDIALIAVSAETA